MIFQPGIYVANTAALTPLISPASSEEVKHFLVDPLRYSSNTIEYIARTKKLHKAEFILDIPFHNM